MDYDAYEKAYNERMARNNLRGFSSSTWTPGRPASIFAPKEYQLYEPAPTFDGPAYQPTRSVLEYWVWFAIIAFQAALAWSFIFPLITWFKQEYWRRLSQQDPNIQAQRFYTRYTCAWEIFLEILWFPFKLTWSCLVLIAVVIVTLLRRLLRPFMRLYYFITDYIHGGIVFVQVLHRTWTESHTYHTIWWYYLRFSQALTVGNLTFWGFSVFMLWFLGRQIIVYNEEAPPILYNGVYPSKIKIIPPRAHFSKEIPERRGAGPAIPDFGSIGRGWPTNARWQHFEDEPMTWTIWADKHCKEVAPHRTQCYVTSTFELSSESTEEPIWDSATDEPLSFAATVTNENGIASTVAILTTETTLLVEFPQMSDMINSESVEERKTHESLQKAVSSSWPFMASSDLPHDEDVSTTEHVEQADVSSVAADSTSLQQADSSTIAAESTSPSSKTRADRFKHTFTSAWTWETFLRPWETWPLSSQRYTPESSNVVEDFTSSTAEVLSSNIAVSKTDSPLTLLSRMLHLFPGSTMSTDTKTTRVAGPTPQPTSSSAYSPAPPLSTTASTSVPLLSRLITYLPGLPSWPWSSSTTEHAPALKTIRYAVPVATPFTSKTTRTPPGTDFDHETHANAPFPTASASRTFWARGRSAIAGAKSYIRNTGSFRRSEHKAETRAPVSYHCSNTQDASCTPPAPGLFPDFFRARSTVREVVVARPAPGAAVTPAGDEAHDRYEEPGSYHASPVPVAISTRFGEAAAAEPRRTGSTMPYYKVLLNLFSWDREEPLFADSYSTEKPETVASASSSSGSAGFEDDEAVDSDYPHHIHFTTNLPSGQIAEFIFAPTEASERVELARKVREGSGIVEFQLEGEAVQLTRTDETPSAAADQGSGHEEQVKEGESRESEEGNWRFCSSCGQAHCCEWHEGGVRRRA